MSLKLRSAAVSHLGLIRSGNQDSVYAGQWLIAVADGMGGMAAGDLASAITIYAIAPVDRPTADDELV
ncbi:MAG TPA: serine/threonine-protein phosphatase, partial [Micromonosporaceae bacterium]